MSEPRINFSNIEIFWLGRITDGFFFVDGIFLYLRKKVLLIKFSAEKIFCKM